MQRKFKKPPRVSDLVRGKWDKFSLDMLSTLAARAGRKIELTMTYPIRPFSRQK
ncbi:MAG: XRE family transcriptional regulator [Rhodoferax sp.]|nr:XRE family transcriptional regulator [Rhodoferax sp.]